MKNDIYIKANVKQYEIKELVAVYIYIFINFNKKYLQNLKYNVYLPA